MSNLSDFVADKGLTSNQVVGVNSSLTLPSTIGGGSVQFTPTSVSINIVMPLASTITLGQRVSLWNGGTKTVVLQRQSPDTFTVASGVSPTSITLNAGDNLVLETSSVGGVNNWVAVSGTAVIAYAGAMAAAGFTTQPSGDSSTKLSTTAFVDVVRQVLVTALGLKAPLANPEFTGQVVMPSGTLAKPGFTFSGEPVSDTGLFHPADGNIGLVCDGQLVATFALTNSTFFTPLNSQTPATSDASTLVATTAFVKAQNYLKTLTAPLVNTALGYTPVQQGGGVNQLDNKMKLGWGNNSRAKLTVDTTDLGNIVMDADLTGLVATQFASSLTTPGYQKMAGGLIFQWAMGGYDGNNSTEPVQVITFPIAFPNACLGAMVSPDLLGLSNSADWWYQTSGATRFSVNTQRQQPGTGVFSTDSRPFVFAIGF